MKKKVLFIKPLIKGYRLDFFSQLNESLEKKNIDLTVAYGVPDSSQHKKKDNFYPTNNYYRKIFSHYFFYDKIYFQWPGLKLILSSDLIIVVNANRHLLNYILLFFQFIGISKVAFWGHDKNYQQKKFSFFEKFKKFIIKKPSYWFAYTNDMKKRLISNGYSSSKITVINNTLNTIKLSKSINSLKVEKINKIKKALRIKTNDIVALFCGSLYQDKKIDFLIETASQIYLTNKNFRLLIIGDGPYKSQMNSLISNKEYISYVGPIFNDDRFIYFKISNIILNPGLVGLGIFDAFVSRKPFFTLKDSPHSPEIFYLKNNFNGFIVDGDLHNYVERIHQIIKDKNKRNLISQNAFHTSMKYTLEKMVSNTVSGILIALNIK